MPFCSLWKVARILRTLTPFNVYLCVRCNRNLVFPVHGVVHVGSRWGHVAHRIIIAYPTVAAFVLHELP